MMMHQLPPTTWVRPRLTLFGRRCYTFRVCGVTGLALGTSLALFLAGHAGLSRLMVCGLLAMGVVTFLTLAMVTKILTGRESLVYYHHEVAVLAVSAALLSALGQPVLPYLDVTALGLGVFLACGRCGCLMVGCCHGKPYRWGVRYSAEHAREGFPGCYVGVRLFPVQAVESVIVLSIVLAGSVFVLQHRPAGSALSWYVICYSVARIWLEELRGDRARPYWLRLSEAQWTSLLLILSMIVGEWQGRLPLAPWHIVLCAGASLSLVVLAASRTAAQAIVLPRHASEVAEILQSPPAPGGLVAVRRTSLTVGVSTQSLGRLGNADAVLYSLSRADRHLSPDEARALAGLIANMASRSGNEHELVQGRHDVFHLILRETPG